MVVEIDWSCCNCTFVWRGVDNKCPSCKHIRNPLHKHESENACMGGITINAKEHKAHKKTRERS